MTVPQADLKSRYESMRADIDVAVQRVLKSGWFILGKELEGFERAFAEYIGVKHCIGVGNGTDAIEIALRALGIGVGDEVITVSHTATFTALGITAVGATPVFVDINERTYTMDPTDVASVITPKTKAILPVHLYGYPAEMDSIMRLATKHDLVVIEDAAQAHGARYNGKRVGSIGRLGCFSFYPSKNLGAFGDAGAITTDDDALADRVKMIRNGGQSDRYTHLVQGVNSRCDEMQAAILSAELRHLESMNARRKAIAQRYLQAFSQSDLVLPVSAVPPHDEVWHLFVVRAKHRDEFRKRLEAQGVQTQIHYPTPAHLQKAFTAQPHRSLPITERIVGEIVTLPLYAEMNDAQVEAVIQAVLKIL